MAKIDELGLPKVVFFDGMDDASRPSTAPQAFFLGFRFLFIFCSDKINDGVED